ncbi:hypothetical protein ZIOFF_043210 [Zingiber officinale]|uniref:Peroxidase n=1 Tax=Zingiber officinale TaxID=94328 RepID=A0A8J5G006_ZINOF|nr:hypothetical protein ZIOFF_043210 [Zingiber officinale]
MKLRTRALSWPVELAAIAYDKQRSVTTATVNPSNFNDFGQAFNADVLKTDDIDAHLLRMHFHDFFVRVILIDSANGNTAEKDAEINQ